jgi:hexosaminidase
MPKSVNLEDSILLITSNRFQIISKQEISHDLELVIKRYSKYIELLIDSSSDASQTPSSENILVIDCLTMHTEKGSYPKLGEDESYKLNIKKTGVYLNAATMTGVIRGLSTFVQLIEQTTLSSGLEQRYIRLGSIVDQPRYPWRGLLLDVSRHWMPVSVIERTLNAMELSKLNVLHFHLSDDQGFRVESLRHPLLHDRKDYFTQKDIRYLVEYARQRRIRIVPEFDIPGHTTR